MFWPAATFDKKNSTNSTDIFFPTARTMTQNFLRIPLNGTIDSNVRQQMLIQQSKMLSQERIYTFRFWNQKFENFVA